MLATPTAHDFRFSFEACMGALANSSRELEARASSAWIEHSGPIFPLCAAKFLESAWCLSRSSFCLGQFWMDRSCLPCS